MILLEENKVCNSDVLDLGTTSSLEECFNMLDAKKAIGLDGVTKSEYAAKLDENLEDLEPFYEDEGPKYDKEKVYYKEGVLSDLIIDDEYKFSKEILKWEWDNMTEEHIGKKELKYIIQY